MKESVNKDDNTFDSAVNLVLNDVHEMYSGDLLVINESKLNVKHKFVKFSKFLDFEKIKIINSDYYLENKKITVCLLEIKNEKDAVFISSKIILGLRESASYFYKIGIVNNKVIIIDKKEGVVS